MVAGACCVPSSLILFCVHLVPNPHLQASKYNIGGYDYVLDDLENGILRGNSPAASTIGMLLKLPWLSKGPFKAGNPRAQHVSHNANEASCAALFVLQLRWMLGE